MCNRIESIEIIGKESYIVGSDEVYHEVFKNEKVKNNLYYDNRNELKYISKHYYDVIIKKKNGEVIKTEGCSDYKAVRHFVEFKYWNEKMALEFSEYE